jgi:ankyrin repeat protein
VDEFALLMRMVRDERVQFLREIHYKQIFSVTQKDMITGDSALHLAVFEGRTDFVKNIVCSD